MVIGSGLLIHGILTDSFHLLDYTTMMLPYVLKKRNNVLF